MPVDYQKGMIYKIVALNCENPDEVYYGSTTQGLAKRLGGHKANFYLHKKKEKGNLTTSHILFEKYGLENCKIVLVENYPCNSNNELKAKEAEYILSNKCVNKYIPNRTNRGWCIDNKEKLAEYKKDYSNIHNDKLLLYYKARYNNKRDEILDKMKEQYNKNKEEKIAYQKQYATNNEIKLKEKFDCICGGKYTHKSKSTHFKTKMHQTFLSNQKEPTTP